MKKIFFFLSFLAFVSCISAQTKPTRNIGRETKVTVDVNTDIPVIIDSSGKKVGRLMTAEEMKRYANTDTVGNYAKYRAGLLPTAAAATFQNKGVYEFNRDIDTQNLIDSAAALRNNINYVSANTEAVYAKKSDIGAGAKATFYVDRKWTGSRGGASWIAQANSAKVGSTAFSFPDPWAARDSAVKYIKNGTLTSVLIYVLSGNNYSYGDIGTGSDYESASGVKYYSSTTSDSATSFNLAYHNLSYFFDINTGLTDKLTSSKPIFSDGGKKIKFILDGYCDFYKVNKVSAQAISISNILSGVSLKFNTFSTKGTGSGTIFYVDAQFFVFKAKTVNAVTAYSMWTNSITNGSALIEIQNHNVGKYAEIATGEAVGSYTVADVNTPYIIRNISASTLIIRTETANIEDSEGIYNYGCKNSKVLLSIGTLTQSSQAGQYGYAAVRAVLRGSIDSFSYINLDINYANTDMPVMLSETFRNSNTNVNIAESIYNNTSANANPTMDITSDSTSSITIGGRFESSTNNIVISRNFTNATLNGYYKTTATGKSALSLISTSKLKLAGALQGENTITGTGAVIVMPSATANVAAAGTVTLQGATLNINSAFKF